MHEPVPGGTSFGRYEIVHPLAAGGMGTVYLGRMRAARGVSLAVAIKRINPALSGDKRVLGMFLDEARITALVRHPNVVHTLDVVEEAGELLLVMEYVHGVSMAHLLVAARERGERLPLAVIARIASDVLHGLHAAHEATSAEGRSLEIVHRDVSPQNVLVGDDGVSRVADFGIAHAANRLETTRVGEIKGKLRYIAPEQYEREAVDRRADIYGVGLLLWEMITGRPMRRASAPGGLTTAILAPVVDPPSRFVDDVPPALDDVVLRALANDPRDRFPFADRMAVALEEAVTPAPYVKVSELLRELGRDELTERKILLDRASAPGLEPSPASAPTPAPAPVPTPRRDRWRVAALLAFAAFGTLLVYALRRTPAPAPTPIASAAPPPPIATIPPPSSPPDPAPAPAALAPPSPAVHTSSTHKPFPSNPRTSPRPKRDCTIPYVVDSKGIRVPRPECL